MDKSEIKSRETQDKKWWLSEEKMLTELRKSISSKANIFKIFIVVRYDQVGTSVSDQFSKQHVLVGC